jgi:hypothetical protein
VLVIGRATHVRRDCTLATVDPRALSATLSELLELGDYERLTDFIRHVRLAGEGPAGDVWGDVHEAACLICEVCSHEQAEAAWHRETLDRIERGKQELDGHLRTMIELIRKEADWAGAAEEQLAGVPVHGSAPSGRLVGKPASARSRADARSPVLAVHCLGPFHAHFSDRDVEHWPNGKGKSIFKFLVTQRERPVGKEILMELFWPNADPYAARNNLNVAIYGLRQAFAKIRRSCSVVLFQDDRYLRPAAPRPRARRARPLRSRASSASSSRTKRSNATRRSCCARRRSERRCRTCSTGANSRGCWRRPGATMSGRNTTKASASATVC